MSRSSTFHRQRGAAPLPGQPRIPSLPESGRTGDRAMPGVGAKGRARWGRWICRVFLTFALPLDALRAQPATPVIEGPPVLMPGKTQPIRMRGGEPGVTPYVWTSWAGPASGRMDPSLQRPPTGAAGSVEISVPAGLPNGIEWVRILAQRSISPPRWLLIDTLPTVAPSATNTTLGQALPLTAPVALDDHCVERGHRYYRLRLSRGVPVGIEVVAQRLGLATDPVLRILDEQGRERLYCNDTPGLDGDCAVEFIPDRSGDIIVEVRDAEHNGGERHGFRLRVGRFPVAMAPDATAPSAERMQWVSPVSRGGGRLRVLAGDPSVGAPVVRWSAANRAHGLGLIPRWDRAAAWQVENEPNDLVPNPDALDGSRVVHGRFDRDGDLDRFFLEVKQPGRWRFEVRSRSRSWSADPLLHLRTADGKWLASAGPDGVEAMLEHPFTAPGRYQVVLEEASGRGGVARGYALVTRPDAPGFSASASSDAVVVPLKGETQLKVAMSRSGHEGRVVFHATRLPPGVTMEVSGADAKSREATLVFKAIAPGAEVGTWSRVGLTAVAEGKEQPVVVQFQGAIRASAPSLMFPPDAAADYLWVLVAPETAEKPGKPAE